MQPLKMKIGHKSLEIRYRSLYHPLRNMILLCRMVRMIQIWLNLKNTHLDASYGLKRWIGNIILSWRQVASCPPCNYAYRLQQIKLWFISQFICGWKSSMSLWFQTRDSWTFLMLLPIVGWRKIDTVQHYLALPQCGDYDFFCTSYSP